jgi:hypothetical protein
MSGNVIRLGVEAVELHGPGLVSWDASVPILAGAEAYRATPLALEAPPMLSAAERRRAIASVKLALGVGAAAAARSGHDPRDLPAVFASSGADGETICSILAALATPAREVSPTRFHNSVHNAPSGYWGVATQSREAVTSVSCFDASFAGGLLEAGVQSAAADRPVLLIAYDVPYPEPLHSVRRIGTSFGVALVLSPLPSSRAIAELHIAFAPVRRADTMCCEDAGLEQMRGSNPAARSLPLLIALAGQRPASVCLSLGRGTLEVGVVPC